MKIVIPLGDGSTWQNNELRYALRSFEKHLAGITGLVIVGNKPGWIDCENITAADLPLGRNKEYNIYNKVRKACLHIKEPFLFANDDHFINQDYDIATFPNYYFSSVGQKKIRKGNPYQRTVANTLKLLGDYPYYDIHCPIVINPDYFNRINMQAFSRPYGFLLKTLYMSLVGADVPREEQSDYKHSDMSSLPDISNRPWYSVSDSALTDEFKNMLEKLYPTKSRWEL